MPNKMLIDASHPEETRVVVVRGNRIEEFDFESENKKQLKGNIYLARVTRVEPSLQAAFVEYGGNRHGFLAFSEIHPDYYQIPVADRQALLRADAEDAAEEDDEDGDGDNEEHRNRRRRGRGRSRGRASDAHHATDNDDNGDNGDDDNAALSDSPSSPDADANTDTINDDPDEDSPPAVMSAAIEADIVSEEVSQAEIAEDGTENGDAVVVADSGEALAPATTSDHDGDNDADADASDEAAADASPDADNDGNSDGDDGDHHDNNNGDSNGDDEVVSVGADDALDEAHSRRRTPRKHYKIQEVIKRRQILLVQVVKEERGNKGAALTTYLSLAGRYSVLMPNTARGGGISRKITNAADRKRLKDVVKDLQVPQGMGVILRTAGESRTKAEIKRDYEYLMRLWDNVRELTMKSSAPALVYEEGSLIKRSVRDLYNKDISEILVAGEEGYREAKDFMRMLMPSHAKVVQPYRDTIPIFARNGIEGQLDRMVQPQVTLKSGGYIIINQTEALVAIDVNSGRSTKEHSIEDTALQTNLEAAEEVSRQLRLRDLAGLIVIDFIDMEENRNNRAVEKRLKECLKNDRARIQVGRISHFGLLEMSRQRLRASVLESTMQICSHCGGTGHVRSESSVALLVIRAIEEFLLKDSRHHITVRMPVSTAIYVLNHKRANLSDLENRFGVTITVEADDSVRSQHYAIAKGMVAERPAGFVPIVPQITYDIVDDDDDIEDVAEEIEENEDETTSQQAASNGNNEEDSQHKRRRRRRRRRGGRDHEEAATAQAATEDATTDEDASSEDGDDDAVANNADEETHEASDTEDQPKKRRRGKRGGRRNRRDENDGDAVAAAQDEAQALAENTEVQEQPAGIAAETVSEVSASTIDESAQAAVENSPEEVVVSEAAAETGSEPVEMPAPEEAPKKRPARRTTRKAKPAEAGEQPAEPQIVEAVIALDTEAVQEEPAPKPKRAPRRRAAAKPAEVSETADGAKSQEQPVVVPSAAPEVVEVQEANSVTETVPELAAKPAPVITEVEETKPVEPVVTSNGETATDTEEKPRRAGWWQRKGFF